MNNLTKIILAIITLLVILVVVYFIFLYNPRPEGEDYFSCIRDTFNCDDFSSQESAQEVFDECFPEHGDVHGLDSDGNGVVCESLP